MTLLYDEKTLRILFDIYTKSRNVTITDGNCLGCGINKGVWEEKAFRKRVYCHTQCQKLYHDFYLPLGGKRLPEEDRDNEKKAAVDFPKFLELLIKVDESMATTIIQFAYPNYWKYLAEMRIVMRLKQESKQMKYLIETYLLKPVEKLGRRITDVLTNDELLLFPNLKILYLFPHSEIYYIGTLTRLEKLYIEGVDSIGDNSIEYLVNLKELILVNTLNINNSLMKLTRLDELSIIDNNTITDALLNQLSTSLKKLYIKNHPLLHNSGLSTLTNLTLLSIKSNANITDDGLLPLINLTSLECSRCEWIESWGLSKMRHLTRLIAGHCQRFNGAVLPYKVPLQELVVKYTSSLMETSMNDFMPSLTYLDMRESNISDKSLQYATSLLQLKIKNSPRVSDSSLSLLTNLTTLTINDETSNITRNALRNLTNLRSLDLSESSIEPDNSPLELANLEVLIITGTRAITNQDLEFYRNLTWLDLTGNHVIDGSSFFLLVNLTRLDINGNSSLNYDSLKSLNNLKIISLINNHQIDKVDICYLWKLETIILFDGSESVDCRDVNIVRERELLRRNRLINGDDTDDDDDDDDDDEIREEFVIDDYGTDDDVNIF